VQNKFCSQRNYLSHQSFIQQRRWPTDHWPRKRRRVEKCQFPNFTLSYNSRRQVYMLLLSLLSLGKSLKGLSIKDVRSQGEGVCPVRTFFGQGGEGHSSDLDVRTFWQKKLQIFQNLLCVRTTGSWAMRTFLDKGRGGHFFAIFCGHLLWAASNGIPPHPPAPLCSGVASVPGRRPLEAHQHTLFSHLKKYRPKYA